VIFGIQPESMEQGKSLSPCLQQHVGSYIKAILREVNEK
jgi:hypothetical protein